MTLPPSSNRDLEQACLLLQEYSFELGGYVPEELMQLWQQALEVDPAWIRAAVLEALYQGRYKAFSVEQILSMWKRRRQPIRHFNPDFERLVFGPLDPHFNPTVFIPGPLAAAPNRPADRTVDQGEPPPAGPEDPSTDGPETPSAAAPVVLPEPVPFTPVPLTPVSEPEHHSAAIAAPATEAAIAPSVPVSASFLPVIAPTEPSEEPFNAPEPIQKFVPVQQQSGFYNRLQAVARHLSP